MKSISMHIPGSGVLNLPVCASVVTTASTFSFLGLHQHCNSIAATTQPTIPYNTIPYQTMAWCPTALCKILPFHIMPYHLVSTPSKSSSLRLHQHCNPIAAKQYHTKQHYTIPYCPILRDNIKIQLQKLLPIQYHTMQPHQTIIWYSCHNYSPYRTILVLGKLGPGQSGPGQLGPGQLGPGQLGPICLETLYYKVSTTSNWSSLQLQIPTLQSNCCTYSSYKNLSFTNTFWWYSITCKCWITSYSITC